jgi:ubiquinone/menaquinone biosynthesis C-methylase UbiE
MAAMQDKTKEAIGQWSGSAPYWEKYRAETREMFAPVAQALIEEAGISQGRCVLDVATGPGEPALTIADAVGPDGMVVGTDIVAEMVEAARREAERRKLKNVRFEVTLSGGQGSDSLPFADNTFDAAVSRFGVMFFPAPVDCLREILRVLKPGGKIAMAVWSFSENNPFDYVLSRIVERYMQRYVEPAKLPVGSSDMFRFAKPGNLLALLLSAGAVQASERVLRFAIRASVSVEEFWTLRSEISEKLRTKLALLSDAQRADLRLEAIAAFRAYAVEGGVSFPAEVLIVSGAKSSE